MIVSSSIQITEFVICGFEKVEIKMAIGVVMLIVCFYHVS